MLEVLNLPCFLKRLFYVAKWKIGKNSTFNLNATPSRFLVFSAQSCGLLAEDWPQSFEQYTQNGQYFRQNVMIWLFKKYFGLFRLHSYLSAAPSVKQGHVFFIYSRPYLRLGAHNSAPIWAQMFWIQICLYPINALLKNLVDILVKKQTFTKD